MSSTEAIDLAVTAEALGYATVWVGELRAFDAFGLASAIAAATASITVVVGPLPSTTRSAAQLAMGCATVSDVGGRPSHLALGASSPAIVTGWHGRPWADVVGETAAVVRAVRSILSGTHDGFRLQFPSPASTVRLAAQGPRMQRLAAEEADGLVLNLVAPAQVGAARAAVGNLPIATWVPVRASRDDAAAHAFLGPYLRAPGYAASLAALAPDGTADPSAVAVLADAVFATADGTLADRLSCYDAAGTTEVVVLPVADSQATRMELLRAGRRQSVGTGGSST